jgi:hypothetical protein
MGSTGTSGNVEIRVSVSCLAELASSGGRSVTSALRPYKLNKGGEGFIRSIYYKPTITAIRAYHLAGNSPQTFDKAVRELEALAASTTKKTVRAKCTNNVRAIEAYRRIYGNRNFTIRANHRLRYLVGGIVVTAQPDVWAQEEGSEVLLKIGIAKKKRMYVDILLTVMRKAAISSGRRIRAKNFVYLDVSTGNELICLGGLKRFNRMLTEKAREILAAWPSIN